MTASVPTVVSFVNLKGGVGKTALSVNFAAFCGVQGYKTLLIDLDPQTNATFSCMSVEDWQTHSKDHGTVADLIGPNRNLDVRGKSKTAEMVLVKGALEGVDLIPSHLDLFTLDLDLGGETAREKKLKRALRDTLPQYDIVICDCPPNLTLPTQNALALSTHYVVPVSPDFLSSLGIALLVSRVKRLSEELENNIEHAGIVLSRVGRPSIFRSQTTRSIRETFGELVLDAEIHERSAVTEATAKSTSIFKMRDAQAISEFEAMGHELLGKLGLT